jgi:alkylation response protein AidB-like acyl-CoA dehydrogenase
MGGRAVRTDGGYRITGRWPFASGSPFATWLGGMSVVCGDDGSPVTDASGQPQRLLAIWPADQARLIDTWDGLGLRGTGSGDFEISDLFVPDEQVNPGFYGPPAYDRALFRIKEMPEVGHGAHALGIASAALEAFTSAVNAKPAQGSARQAAMGHQQAHQIAFARADALVRAARALLHGTVRAAYADASVHPELSLELRVRLREANIFAVRAAKDAVGLIFDMAGSSAVYRGRPIEQAFRDISTAANHTNYMEAAYAAVGSYYLTRDREEGPEIAGRPFF